MCARRRLKSACESAQSYQTFRCQQEEALHNWLSKLPAVKILIKLSQCAALIGIFSTRMCLKVRLRFPTLRLILSSNRYHDIDNVWFEQYSRLSLSGRRLFRISAYLEVKIRSLLNIEIY